MKLEIRPFKPEDLPVVLKGFEVAFGHARNLEEWRWRYERNPYGSWIELGWNEANGSLLAHYAVLGVLWQHKGRSLRVGQVVDVFTGQKPGLFRRGPLTQTIESLLKRITGPGLLAALYGFPNSRAARLGRLTGVYPWEGPVFVWTPGPKIVSPKAQGWLEAGWNHSGVEQLWDRAQRRYSISAVRNAHFYECRFLARPHTEYEFLGWRRNGRLRAWCVLRREEKEIRWVDLLWDGESTEDLLSLAAGLLAGSQGAPVRLWLTGDCQAAAVLADAGWENQEHSSARIVARSFDPDLAHDDFKSAYLTLADSDLA